MIPRIIAAFFCTLVVRPQARTNNILSTLDVIKYIR